MKAKKFRKKLSVNKQTIAHLSNFEMNDVPGGQDRETIPTSLKSDCPACITINNCITFVSPC
ncbi:MAG: class I lanthipeptide [Candidatus Aminicenantes bacterium]